VQESVDRRATRISAYKNAHLMFQGRALLIRRIYEYGQCPLEAA